MLRTRNLFASLVLVAGVSLPGAHAGLIPNKVTITPDSGNFVWDYQVVVTSDLYVSKGDFFTIYDFSGNIAGKEVYDSANWTLTKALSSPVPAKYGSVNPNDDPNVENLTLTYTGNATIIGSSLVGNFLFTTPYDVKTDSVFTSVNHRIDNTVNGPDPQEFNLTPTVVAAGGVIDPPDPVDSPEPATLALLGAALPVLIVRKFRRK